MRGNTNQNGEIRLEETVTTTPSKQRCEFIGKKTRKCYFDRHLSVSASAATVGRSIKAELGKKTREWRNS